MGKTHLCLVLPAMVSDGQITTATGKPRHAAYIQRTSRQILLVLDFLHRLSITHCGKSEFNAFDRDSTDFMQTYS